MNSIAKQPDNLNILTNVNFKMSFNRIPNFEFFLQSLTIPDITLGGPVQIPTRFIDIQSEGDKVVYGQLITNIIVNESLTSYTEVYDWLNDLGFPENHTQFGNLEESDAGLHSDGEIIILSNNSNPTHSIRFKDMFPMNIGSLDFTSIDSDSVPMICSVTFAFTGPFVITKL